MYSIEPGVVPRCVPRTALRSVRSKYSACESTFAAAPPASAPAPHAMIEREVRIEL